MLWITISPSSARMTSRELSKKACSKPSCISISSTAKPMPLAERSSRGLFARRLRQASGTEPGRAPPTSCVPRRGSGEGATDKKGPCSEHVGGIGASQTTDREQRRNQRHSESCDEHREEAHLSHCHRQQC